jgi:hypothetical protein
MKITIDVCEEDDIKWLEPMSREKRLDTIRNCITIGRLALENFQVHIDASKNFEPIISKFREELNETVQRTLDSVGETRDELCKMSGTISQQLAVNNHTMMESLKSQNSIAERIIDPISNRIDRVNIELEKIFGVKGSSNVKGKLGESIVAQHIQSAFPDYEVADMSYSPHEADYHVSTEYGKVLLEIKTYTASVNKEQIEKLYNDIDRTGMNLAIFLSTTSGIVGKKHIQWEIYGKNRCIILYVPNSGLTQQGILFAILFLKALVSAGINKEGANTFYKSEEELHNLLAMFEDFYNELEAVLERQCKLRYEIGTVKGSIDQLLDNLYKHCFELELDQRKALERMYGRIRDKLALRGKSLEQYTWISDSLEFRGFVDSLGVKDSLCGSLLQLYSLLEELGRFKVCYEKGEKVNKLVIVDRVSGNAVCSCHIAKTKIDLVFELPKDFSGCISINPRYESIKGSEITINLASTSECRDIIKARLEANLALD